MNWKQLLDSARLGKKIEIPYDETQYSMSEFEKDYWRIIDCSAFRRLQDKTQVFPLDKSDFVRTRLTHSLEVSALAKQLVAMVYKNIKTFTPRTIKEQYPFASEHAQYSADIAACAGLLHDIGNPPFGHFGEDVVHAWFENHHEELKYVDRETNKEVRLIREKLISDLKHFEGNAQAFRLLTKLHSVDSDQGLNLTAALLNTLIKYPTDSMSIDAESKNVYVHKNGYYYADSDMFLEITKHTGTFFDNVHHRHPLTFILEAADDIAYATADLEDSYKKGLFTLDEFNDFFYREQDKIPNEEQRRFSKKLIEQLGSYRKCEESTAASELQAFQKWINYSRHWLVYCAAYGFTHNYQQIMEGNFFSEIISGTNHEGSMAILKKAMMRFTFNTAGITKLELSAETIIENLLERFVPAAIDWDVPSLSRINKRKAEKKLMTLISENHKSAYLRFKKSDDEEYNLYLRLLLVADFVSGMTDTYAKMLYHELSGI
ncbi:dGTP triphosphohydrolase [Desulfoscipio gibsoniae]